MPKKMLALFVFMFLLGATCYAGGHEQSEHLKVMTRNMDAGSDFGFVLAAAGNPSTTQVQLLMAITQTDQEMLASNIPACAEGLAAEIERTTPDLVGLQEVTILSTGTYGAAPTTVVADGLQGLLQALRRRGLHYPALKVQTNANVQLPAFDAACNLIMVGFNRLRCGSGPHRPANPGDPLIPPPQFHGLDPVFVGESAAPIRSNVYFCRISGCVRDADSV